MSLFRACRDRDKQRRAERQKWGVYAVNKRGELYKRPSATTETESEALIIADRMKTLNSTGFAVRSLDEMRKKP